MPAVAAPVFDDPEDALRDDGGRQRRVGRSDALGHRDQVGLDAVKVAAKHASGAAEAGNNFVGDEQDVVFAQHGLHCGPVAGWRRHEAAGAENRLADKAADGVGIFAEDKRFELRGAAGGKLLLGLVLLRFAQLCAPVVMGCAGAQDGWDGQVHQIVVEAEPGHGAGHDGVAVVTAFAGDDALLAGFADEVVVVPDELGLSLVGIGAGGAVEDLAGLAGGHADEAIGEADQLRRGVAGVGVEVSKLMRLTGDGVGHLGASVADVDAIEAGKSVNQLAALGVAHANALRGIENRRSGLAGRRSPAR
jgi:hypothetical protein